jgi:hypothetical protein
MKLTVLTGVRGSTIDLLDIPRISPYFILPRVMKEG